MDTFLGSLVQLCCREGGTLQTNNTGMCPQCLGYTVCPHSQRVCFPCLHCLGSRLLCQKLSEAALGCMLFPGLSHSGSGTWVVLRGTDSVGPAFCALSQVQAAQVTRCLASAVFLTYRLPHPYHFIFWVYNRRTFSGRFQPSRIPRSLG